ncbi:MAG TPA: hypothetical protein VFQ24_13045 [Terriglobia bacterium]|nr:hypothetical protein [Terriglobia bacterium]
MKIVKDIEEQVAEKVSNALAELDLMPDGYHCEVRLHGRKRDKRRSAAFEKNWSPDTDSIQIRFQRTAEHVKRGTSAPSIVRAEQSRPFPTDPLSDLIRTLDHAESRPGYKFVSLKWFRDTALLDEGFAWAGDYSARQMTLREAIDKRLILTNRVENPKSPQFPVTAIRLNRLMPEVKSILGSAESIVSDFQPLPIRGENLSQTVLRDRR